MSRQIGAHTRTALVIAGALVCAAALLAQRGGFGGDFGRGESFVPEFPKEGDFHFIRTEYTDRPEKRRGFGFVSRNARSNGWWAQDWPDADNHFSFGLQRLTRLDIGEPRHLDMTDERLFDYPWIYLTQAGNWDLSAVEVLKLREYLNRGGFLMVDDFWSQPDPSEWEVFQETMARVLPGHPISSIRMSDSVMHVLYDIEQKDLTFIPGTRHIRGGVVRQPAGTSPEWDTINDDKDRMVVAVNFNTDIGDAWEYADAPEYPADMTTLAYRYGINYIMYAMTH
jgi:Domain of unknown function (DUF4159)